MSGQTDQNGIGRRDFLNLSVGAGAWLHAAAAGQAVAAEPRKHAMPLTVTLGNAAFELTVSAEAGLNPCQLINRHTGWRLATADYFYGFGRPQEVKHSEQKHADGAVTTRFVGMASASLRVTHIFHFPADQDWFEEWVELENTGTEPLTFSESHEHGGRWMRCGFTRSLQAIDDEDANLIQKWQWLAVPFLRHTHSGQRQAYAFDAIGGQPSRRLASEGWVLGNDEHSLLIIKYNQQGLEHALLDVISDENVASGDQIIFGGMGLYRGDPEAAATLEAGTTLRMGTTRYVCVAGHWQQAFYAFRKFMDQRGHRFASDFNPPVHWNVIYDNPHWWNAPDNEAARAKHYRLEHMLEEAAKASELGCEALYMDPGWDTHFGSSIWAADRLGEAAPFIERMRDEFGLSVSLHTPLANWNIHKTYPQSAWIRNEAGENFRTSQWEGFDHGLCSVAPGWWQTKLTRFLELAEAGVTFFMFDGSNYTPCHAPDHGHKVPLTREEHIRAYAELARQLRQQYPKVLIEMHDQVLGPVEARYVTMYYTHHADTFDTIWAFEYMWYSLPDLLSGKALALYYYNLAYNIPLYLHVNLKTDNHHALMFWWYASTCRHLGVGGRDAVPSNAVLPAIGIGEGFEPDLERWEIHKQAMRTYMRLKPFFVRGDFYGLDERIHVHTLPDRHAAVINCFNFEQDSIRQTVRFRPDEVGLDSGVLYKAEGVAQWQQDEGEIAFDVELPGRGTAVIEIQPKE